PQVEAKVVIILDTPMHGKVDISLFLDAKSEQQEEEKRQLQAELERGRIREAERRRMLRDCRKRLQNSSGVAAAGAEAVEGNNEAVEPEPPDEASEQEIPENDGVMEDELNDDADSDNDDVFISFEAAMPSGFKL
ncbi:MAG: hypothetical protein SGPRY_005772, partial [Prymnesium sp.]